MGSNGVVTNQLDESIPVQNVTKIATKRLRRKRNKWTLIVTFLSLVLIIIFITIAYLVAKGLLADDSKAISNPCDVDTQCNMKVVETIPSVLKYKAGSPVHDTISKHWLNLAKLAKSNIDILAFYWSLNDTDVPGGPYYQSKIGEAILNSLKAAALRGYLFYFIVYVCVCVCVVNSV